ncbi:SAM-dependent chlorinase/fluorinase [Trichocoleus sp. DQ-A3]|uniref:SAM hydrolase/SAM-dependent halogenase family protein n=1 Tax=Cyanophyceae TaxID=3028117 RepID=UPI001686113B|nr:SAM-dependent chlorinase/fluorinase [Coleofasciculus sp. FACHB-125]MBD1902035.1 SAM-dependent chlorinase/fluorinase [Coleofasciculus sp. FACHB-125]
MYDNRIVTLTSDFGLSDVYVGVMKGAIAQINPTLTVVDLTHEIPPQNLTAARFCLMNAYPYFPKGTVHIAVVDPGVGSSRRAIAVKFAAGFLVGPDNGLFSGILSSPGVSPSLPEIAAVELTNPDYWRTTEPSSTFHGRDIFAPVGAHLASGVPLEHLGNAIDSASLVQLPIRECTQTEAGIAGCIQYIDRFGNLITNIPGTFVQGKIWSVVVGKFTLPSGQTYSDSQHLQAIALIGSHGWVEIAVNGGNAQSQLQLDWGDEVLLLLD